MIKYIDIFLIIYKNRYYLLYAALMPLYTVTLQAQTLLPYTDYLLQVAQKHPTAQRGSLLNDVAVAQLQTARGNFDPKFSAEWQGKQYNDKLYYSTFNTDIKIPIQFGADVKIAYEIANGINLNPENNTPLVGLATVGISMPLLQGLMIDDRRTAIQQATLLKDINRNEQQILLNDLLFVAALAYWDWAEAYQQSNIAQQALQLSRLRFNDLKNSVLQGERPGIDTIEARLIVQERQLQLQQTQMDYAVSEINLTNFLWQQNQQTIPIANLFLPSIQDTTIVLLLDTTLRQQIQLAAASHPMLNAYQYKLNSLNIDRRLKANKLLPKLNIQYNFLAKQFNYFDNEGYGIPLINNFKWGINAAIPLFLRQERGNLALTDLKLREINLLTDQKRIELNNKIRAQTAKINNIAAQIQLYTQSVRDYQTLLDAENTRFGIGESSIFLVNTRETKLVEAQQKMVSLRMKYYRTRTELAWIRGMMSNQIIP